MPITDHDAIDFGFFVAYADGMVVPIKRSSASTQNRRRGIGRRRPSASAGFGLARSLGHGGRSGKIVIVFFGYLARKLTDQNS
jgi:hypothetical protein